MHVNIGGYYNSSVHGPKYDILSIVLEGTLQTTKNNKIFLTINFMHSGLQDKYLEGYSDGTLDSTGQKFFSCSPGHGFYCPVAELQPDTGSREYCTS